jgi:hypothetical protein
MADAIGYSGDITDSNGNVLYPTTFIENIITKNGNKDIVSKGIIWPAEFIVHEENQFCIMVVKTLTPYHFVFVPTMEYDPNYNYYVNNNKVVIKTPINDDNPDINWKIGVPVLAILKDNILYMMSTTQNAHGEYISNSPVNVSDIKDNDLLMYKDGEYVKYTPEVKHIYYPGQLKNWTFLKEGASIASSASGLEMDVLRVAIYGNDCDTEKATAVGISGVYNFDSYTHLIIKYMNGSQDHSIDFQIHRADDSEAFEIDLPYTASINKISIDIDQYNLENAYITIAASVYESEISECIIMEMKLV